MRNSVIAAAAWHVATHEMLALTAVGIALSLIDDLVVDAVFFALVARRRTRADPLPPRPPGPPSWLAIIIPAWDEADVIGAMLGDLLAALDYPRYRVFVGTYANDPATRRAIMRVGDPRVEMVTCARPGPTTKADCLNHLWRAVVAYEAAAAIRFKAVVLHDAEDVVDGEELALFDAHIPPLAMVQLPVVPLVDAGSRWISGHYLDEFAEAHRKDLIVRGAIGAGVPSAGVACAIDREVLGRLAGPGAAPFDPASMTEDYELGMRIAALGRAGMLVRCRGRGGLIATREHFPATLDAAVRQKTRWLLGIALDGWDRIGWRPGLADRYMLLRDRKTIVAPLLVGLGYLAMAMAAVDGAVRWLVPAAAHFAPLAPPGSLLARLLLVNAAALGWRLGWRAAFTGRIHGWREGRARRAAHGRRQPDQRHRRRPRPAPLCADPRRARDTALGQDRASLPRRPPGSGVTPGRSRPARALRGGVVVLTVAVACRVPAIEREFRAALAAGGAVDRGGERPTAPLQLAAATAPGGAAPTAPVGATGSIKAPGETASVLPVAAHSEDVWTRRRSPPRHMLDGNVAVPASDSTDSAEAPRLASFASAAPATAPSSGTPVRAATLDRSPPPARSPPRPTPASPPATGGGPSACSTPPLPATTRAARRGGGSATCSPAAGRRAPIRSSAPAATPRSPRGRCSVAARAGRRSPSPPTP